MPSFETICKRIFMGKGFWRKFLIGGLLSSVPIVNLFALGFLYRFAMRIRTEGTLELPEWDDPKGLFIDGLKCFAAFFPFYFIPIVLLGGISALISSLFFLIRLDLFALTIAFIPVALAFFIGTPLAITALWKLQEREDFSALLKLEEILGLLKLNFEKLLVPHMAVLGLFVIGWPIFGFAYFLGILVLLPYHAMLFHRQEG
mgnify:CR=1 FL=1